MPPPRSHTLLYQDDNNDPHQSIASFLTTSHIRSTSASLSPPSESANLKVITSGGTVDLSHDADIFEVRRGMSSTSKGILIGMLSAFGSALLIAIVLALVYFFRYTNRGRILLDSIGRPGEYDDEQAFAQEEAEAVEEMDDIQRAEYLRAKIFVQSNPPESVETDISLSQFLAIQEKGVSAWEFEPELEISNCFVEGRTEIEFFDTESSVQTNLPVPKQNEVYYWEAKVYDKPESTTVGVGMTTKPYPLFRMPGYHRTSVAYTSPGHRRFNQPFKPVPNYGPPFVRGDVVGCGYRPRTGTVFFTRNGKKLDDVTHALKTQNLFPTVGANGPCSIHVNFGQMGFVFIEANVKKWGLAPMTGSLAPPPPYGSEAGSILLEGGKSGVHEGQGYFGTPGSVSSRTPGPGRSRSATVRSRNQQAASPGPQRSPTDISLNQLSVVDSDDADSNHDPGEGTSQGGPGPAPEVIVNEAPSPSNVFQIQAGPPPPDYESPGSDEEAGHGRTLHTRRQDDSDDDSTPRASTSVRSSEEGQRPINEQTRLLNKKQSYPPSPPIPSYEAAVGSADSGQISSHGQGQRQPNPADQP